MRRPLVAACLGVVLWTSFAAAGAAGSPAAAAATTATVPAAAIRAKTLVVCAPGYPGTTLEVQPTMDAFASAAAAVAGWKPGDLAVQYHETLKGGLDRLGAADAVLALVTLPFYLQEGARLRLEPRLQVAIEPDGAERWSLVAKKGAVGSPAALDGWEILGNTGYAPAFVRGTVLGSWGEVPATTRIAFAPAALSALRRAASGEKTAVVLDAAGAAALPTLPFAADLEVVARSAALPGSLLCTVGDRLPALDADRLFKGLRRLHQTPDGAAALKSMRLQRFEPVDAAALRAARQAFERALPDARPDPRAAGAPGA